MGSLTGAVALVTGASRGVGKGVALGLAEAGATVYITGRTKEGSGTSLQSTCISAEELGGRCIPIECDHANDSASEAAVALVTDTEGCIDLLVNSAWGGYENMVVVSMYPGLVRTESVVASGFFDLANSESPQFIGRAIAHLFQDPKIQEKNGQVVFDAELAIEYGFTDVDGKQPAVLTT